MTSSRTELTDVAKRAKAAYLKLLSCEEARKNDALQQISQALSQKKHEIIDANQKDLLAADESVSRGEMTSAMRKRLVFDGKKLEGVLSGIQQVIKLPDPTGCILSSMELDDGLILNRRSCPLGVVGVIFESRPEVVVQVSSLLLKAGNAGILKGGKEAQNTNRILMSTIRSALNQSVKVPEDALQILDTREQIQALLACHDSIDLLIPRGSKKLVKYIQDNTKIPVLGHTDGICHVYVHEAADLDKTVNVILDSKVQYPAVCNSAETILVDQKVASAFVPSIVKMLGEHQVLIRGCDKTRSVVPDVQSVAEPDFFTEYLDLVVNIKVVTNIEEAIAHINHYGSGHTDTIMTEDEKAAQIFCLNVDSAGVFVNASTRFSDGYRYGLGAEIGISTNKIHARGPVGLEGIVTYKYELLGQGHIVADYASHNRNFKWRKRK